MDEPRGRLLLAATSGAALSALFLVGALLVAEIGGDDVQVAGAFVLAMFALLLAMATLIGFVRHLDGDGPEGRPVVRAGMGVLAVVGLVLTAWLAWQIGWPHSAAAVITLAPVVVMVRDVLSTT